jgi:hypothetical protein
MVLFFKRSNPFEVHLFALGAHRQQKVRSSNLNATACTTFDKDSQFVVFDLVDQIASVVQDDSLLLPMCFSHKLPHFV